MAKITNNTGNNSDKPEEQIKRGFGDFWVGLGGFLGELTDLRNGLDREGTIVNIKNNKRMRGANAWLLMCSILIASLGLDLNSPAVIIGAMLISPLMSPILGIGLAAGINDRKTLYVSLQHFGIAIAIALVFSTLYFMLTPFGNATPEILARTKPTLLDVMVAFFGGIAGIISGSRKDKSNAIPGVAIATALMPPLCVTGFGIANLMKYGLEANNLNHWLIMSNSFYLFFLNATFVALATYLIVRYLDFPYIKYNSDKEMIRTRWSILGVSALMVIPSTYILLGVLSDVRMEDRINQFVTNNFENAICETTKNIENDTFEVKVFLFAHVDSSAQANYTQSLQKQVSNTKLNFIQSDIPDIDGLEKSMQGYVMNQLEAQQTIKDEKDKVIDQLNYRLDSLNSKILLERAIEKEVKILFPNLADADFYYSDSTRSHDNLPLLLLKWKNTRRSNKNIEKRLYQYACTRAKVDTLELGYR